MIRILDRESQPVVGALLKALRDSQTERLRGPFRDNLRRLGFLLGHELGRHLPLQRDSVQTPFGRAAVPALKERLVIATVLRAGLPLWEGVLEAFPESDVAILSAARAEGTCATADEAPKLSVSLGYAAAPSLSGRILVYVDTMIATGSTLLALHPRLTAQAGTPSQVFILGGIAYEPTLERLASVLGAGIIAASADPELTDAGWIVPGLGDAGDLAFGTTQRLEL